MIIDIETLSLDNPFWQFSLSQWKLKPLQQQLLDLQNTQDHRINLLLLSMWLSFEHKDIRPYYASILENSHDWHTNIVAPIRHARQSLANMIALKPPPLKTQLQACELHAEQIEQALLYDACLNIPATHEKSLDSLDWLIRNLSASSLDKSDLSLLIQNCLPTYPAKRINERLQVF